MCARIRVSATGWAFARSRPLAGWTGASLGWPSRLLHRPHPEVGLDPGDAVLDEARDERGGAELLVLDQLWIHERHIASPPGAKRAAPHSQDVFHPVDVGSVREKN
jgi:hypothetical protein